MIDTIIVSGGDIQSDFALYFLKKNIEKAGRENIRLIAADRGLEFFLDYLILPDVVIGDFDSLSEDGKIFWKCKTKIFHTVGCWSGNCKKVKEK